MGSCSVNEKPLLGHSRFSFEMELPTSLVSTLSWLSAVMKNAG